MCLDVRFGLLLFLPGETDSSAHLCFRDVPLLFAQKHQAVCSDRFGGKGDKRADVFYFAVRDRIDVVFQIFRVGDDDRAVVVVLRVFCLLMLIEHTRMEDGLDAVVDEPLYVPMRELCRVALRFRRDGVHSKLINFSARERGQDCTEAESFEKGRPERIVFVQIQNAWDTDHAARCFVFSKRLIAEDALALVLEQIGRFFT